jgi:hypothetical protein
MAIDAAVESGGHVAAAFEAPWITLENASGERTHPRTDDGTPADSKGDGDSGQANEYKNETQKNL